MADAANIPAALDKVEQALTPATVEQCEGWLVMLQAATAHRQESDATSAVAYTIYAGELARWPADVAKEACGRLARGRPGQTGTNWFPTLAELARECERLASPRCAVYAALKEWRPAELPHPNDRRYSDGPSEQEKAAVRRMAEEAKAALRETADRLKPLRRADLPNTAGKVDETGITPQMRELMARRAAE